VIHQKEGTVGATDILIVSFLFGESEDQTSPFLASLGSAIPAIRSKTVLSSCNLNLLDGLQGSYVRYRGSVSTPPCEETVQYRIMATVQHASRKQLKLFEAALAGANGNGNTRPTQPLAGRIVEYVDVKQYHLEQWSNSLNFTIAQANALQGTPLTQVTPDLDTNGGVGEIDVGLSGQF